MKINLRSTDIPEHYVGHIVYQPFKPNQLYRVVSYDGKDNNVVSFNIFTVKDIDGNHYKGSSLQSIHDLIEDHKKKIRTHEQNIQKFEEREYNNV